MQTIYKITIRFPTVSPLYCERTFVMDKHPELLRLARVVEATPGWEIVSQSIDHLMDAKDVIDEVDDEIDMCMREAHIATMN
jgi:hypothetical protein